MSEYVHNLKIILSADELKTLLSCSYNNIGSKDNPKYIFNIEINKKSEIFLKNEKINKEDSKNILEKLKFFYVDMYYTKNLLSSN